MDYNRVVLRYIIAFSFDTEEKDFDQICMEIKDGGNWLEKRMWVDGVEQDLYDYIIEQLSYRNNKTNIGVAWDCVGKEKLPVITWHYGKNPGADYKTAKIKDMGLYLFRSRVGFLWYELETEDIADSIDELIWFQNTFKELNRPNNKEKYKQLNKDGAEVDFYPGLFIDDILRNLPMEIRYFSRRRDKMKGGVCEDRQDVRFVPDKAILFSYMAAPSASGIIDEDDRELVEWTYYLTSGYNRNYMIPGGIESTFFHPFNNLYWNITNEGCNCSVKYTDANAPFFTKYFPGKCTADYFLIYILLLQQQYSLLRYATWIERYVPAQSDEYMKNVRKSRNSIESLFLSLNTFLTKNVYASVSHIQHQNDFYSFGLEKLRIEENINSINLGTNAINDFLNLNESRREAHDDATRNMLFGVLSILVVFSAMADADQLFDIAWSGRLNNPVYILVVAVITVLAGFAIFGLIRSIIKRRRQR